MTTTVALNEKLFDSLAKDALPKFGLNGWKAKLLQLSENITYLVQNGEAKVVLRISRPGYHPVEEIEAELIWVERIRQYCAVVVAEPLKGVNGEYIQYIRSPLAETEYTCVLYKFLTGQAPDENDEKEILRSFYDLGEITAYLHRYTRDWSLAPQLKRFIWDYDTMLGRNPRWGRWQAAPELDMEKTAILDRAAEIIQKKLRRYGQNRWNFGLIHADLRLANLLVDGITIKVIDFDDCGFGWFLHDLASAVSFIEHKPITKHLIENWLEGYHRVLELEKKDLAMIDTFIMQRRLQLLAWLTSHSESTPVKLLSAGYADGSVRLAEEYLREQL